MSNKAVLANVTDSEGLQVEGHFMMHCPGCNMLHGIYSKEYKTPLGLTLGKWRFNGDMEKPTFSPSLLVTSPSASGQERRVCHSFIRDGQWQFLNDCTHELAGKTVPMVPVGYEW